ncbi:hypothetical protein JTB14_013791 [Gonioctena quinquepunctata]|nr:hypothetical protein JTB14_013791 [Gonioctena quinquepunctata]
MTGHIGITMINPVLFTDTISCHDRLPTKTATTSKKTKEKKTFIYHLIQIVDPIRGELEVKGSMTPLVYDDTGIITLTLKVLYLQADNNEGRSHGRRKVCVLEGSPVYRSMGEEVRNRFCDGQSQIFIKCIPLLDTWSSACFFNVFRSWHLGGQEYALCRKISATKVQNGVHFLFHIIDVAACLIGTKVYLETIHWWRAIK